MQTSTGEATPSVRGIVLSLSGLLLAGCMQSAPIPDAIFTARDSSSSRTHPISKRGFHPPISVRSLITTGPNHQALSSSIPLNVTFTLCCPGKAFRYGAIVGEVLRVGRA